MRRKKRQEDAQTGGDRRLTPVDVQQVEFRLAFRGYSERDVDAFLDRVTEELSAYLEENERLRAGAALPPAAPQPWAVDARADADSMLAKAREEADAIVRRAEAEAAAIRAAATSVPLGTPGDARAAVAPFLNREREFLQALGTLVQSHAEEIKGMVLALRSKSEAAPDPATTQGSVGAQPVAAPPPMGDGDAGGQPSALFGAKDAGGGPTAASAEEISDRLGMSTVTMSNAPSDADEEDDDAPVIIGSSSTEPVFSSEGAPAGESRERSLRELFWGED